MEEGAPCSRAPRLVLGLLLLGLLFLSGAPPALGNEGGAAGSCKCPKTNVPPRNVQSIASKLEAWEHCEYLVRFTFPKRNICGLDGEPWVEELKSLTPSKRKGAETTEASKGVLGPTLVSRISPLALTSTRPLARTPTDEPLQVQLDPQFTTAMPWAHKPSQEETPKIHLPSDGPFVPGATLDTPGLTRSPTTAGQGAAGVGPGHLAPQASPTQHNKIAVPVLLAIMLLLMAIIVFLLCRKNGQPCRRALDTPLPPQDPDKRKETLALRHSEET